VGLVIASISPKVEAIIQQQIRALRNGEFRLNGAIRLYPRWPEIPEAVFIGEDELRALELHGYDRRTDPLITKNAVVLIIRNGRVEFTA
jgi:hypothetical protein